MPKHTPDSSPIQLELPFEQWRDIPGYEGLYQVSDHGRVRKVNTRRHKVNPLGVLKPVKTPTGYCVVSLYRGNQVRQIRIHRLVLVAFIGDCPDMQANHLNGNKSDNHLENLEWVTSAENHFHKNHVLGHPYRGEQHGSARLKDEDIRQIIELHQSGLTIADIARRYSVDRTTVSKIMNGNNWSHITGFSKKAGE